MSTKHDNSLVGASSGMVYVSGVTENTMSFHLDKGKLRCYENGQAKNINVGNTLVLGNVTVEVCGTVQYSQGLSRCDA